jgi:hypothetical protein
MLKFIVTAKRPDGSYGDEVIEAGEWEVEGGALLLFTRLGPKQLVKAYGPAGWVSFTIAEPAPTGSRSKVTKGKALP